MDKDFNFHILAIYVIIKLIIWVTDPGGGLGKPTDRDQKSWVFLNDPKKTFH